MIDPGTFEKAVAAVENDPEFVRLIIEGTEFTGDRPIYPDDLGYSPVIMKVILRAKEISHAIFRSDDAFDYMRVFRAASNRITRRYFPTEMAHRTQTRSSRRSHILRRTLARVGRLLLPKKGK
jgi:hypothetical protein